MTGLIHTYTQKSQEEMIDFEIAKYEKKCGLEEFHNYVCLCMQCIGHILIFCTLIIIISPLTLLTVDNLIL